MTTPLRVRCPQCQAELDLSVLPEIPPAVRCGQCQQVFPTQAADAEGPRTRWKTDPAADPSTPPPTPAAVTGLGKDSLGKHGLGEADGLVPGGDAGIDPLLPGAAAPRGAASAPLPPHLAGGGTGAAPVAVGAASAAAEALGSPTLPATEVEEPLARYRRRRRGVPGMAWVLLGCLVLVGAAVAMVLVYLQQGPFELAMGSNDVLAGQREPTRVVTASGPVEWTDASRYSVRLANVRVKAHRFELAEVRARDDRARLQTSEGRTFLQVFLTIENERMKPLDYTSWYGNIFTVDGVETVARLVDSGGREYPMMVFDDALSIHGHTPRARLDGQERIRDTLVFDLEDVQALEGADSFRLSLPGAAFGEPGTLRFELPASMLERVSGDRSLLDAGTEPDDA